MSFLLNQSKWRVFYQKFPGGTLYLLNASVGDIEEPEGSINPVFNNSLGYRGGYRLVDTNRDSPGLVNFDITAQVTNKQKFIDAINCPSAAIILVASTCANPELAKLDKTGMIMVIENLNSTGKTTSSLTGFDSQDQPTLVTSVTAGMLEVPKLYFMSLATETTAEVTNGNSIAVVDASCASQCGAKVEPLEIYYVATDAGAGVPANLLYRSDANTTPSATTADPFAADEHISLVKVVPISSSQIRVIVGRGSTDAGNPAEIAYSDVYPYSPDVTVWTAVDIGTTNAEFLTGTGSLMVLDNGTALAGTDQGKLHISIDYGSTWADVNSPTSVQVNDIKPLIDSIGPRDKSTFAIVTNANGIYTTNNSARTWVTVSGPSAQAAVNALTIHAFNEKDLWVGYADGELYHTTNGGGTWTESVLPKPVGFDTVDRVNRVWFINKHIGFASGMATDSAAEFGIIWQTYDGGKSWIIFQELTTYSEATPTGINDIYVSDPNNVIGVGDSIGALTSITILNAGDKE